MDIDYLLLLQNFREATGNIFTPFFYAVSEFAISFWPIAFFALVYWAYDKKTGFWFLLNIAGANFLNGILKLTACVYRPWIRDSRIVPAGNSLFSATGYSFPSGHSTCAGAFYGSIGVNQWKKRKWVSVTAFVFAALTLFSRNYLGVHTPQDVIVGFFNMFSSLTPASIPWCSISCRTSSGGRSAFYGTSLLTSGIFFSSHVIPALRKKIPTAPPSLQLSFVV